MSKDNGRLVIAVVRPSTRMVAGLEVPQTHDFIIEADCGLKDKISEVGGVYRVTEYGRNIGHYFVKISEMYDPQVVIDNIMVVIEEATDWRPDAS